MSTTQSSPIDNDTFFEAMATQPIELAQRDELTTLQLNWLSHHAISQIRAGGDTQSPGGCRYTLALAELAKRDKLDFQATETIFNLAFTEDGTPDTALATYILLSVPDSPADMLVELSDRTFAYDRDRFEHLPGKIITKLIHHPDLKASTILSILASEDTDQHAWAHALTDASRKQIRAVLLAAALRMIKTKRFHQLFRLQRHAQDPVFWIDQKASMSA